MTTKAPRLHVPDDRDDLTLTGKREPKTVDLRNATIIPSGHQLLSDAQAILSNELTRLRGVSVTVGLTPKQTQQFARYVRAITELAKEERERWKLDELDRMSDEDLLDLLMESEEVRERVREMLEAKNG